MSMTWENHLDLEGIARTIREHVQEALGEGAQLILDRSTVLVPKESTDLAASGAVRKDRGGLNTVGITYDGPYARYVHEHLFFKHPTGGQAKFLEDAMLTQGGPAIDKAGEVLWDKVTARTWGS